MGINCSRRQKKEKSLAKKNRNSYRRNTFLQGNPKDHSIAHACAIVEAPWSQPKASLVPAPVSACLTYIHVQAESEPLDRTLGLE
jgi:hypothetical protein